MLMPSAFLLPFHHCARFVCRFETSDKRSPVPAVLACRCRNPLIHFNFHVYVIWMQAWNQAVRLDNRMCARAGTHERDSIPSSNWSVLFLQVKCAATAAEIQWIPFRIQTTVLLILSPRVIVLSVASFSSTSLMPSALKWGVDGIATSSKENTWHSWGLTASVQLSILSEIHVGVEYR